MELKLISKLMVKTLGIQLYTENKFLALSMVNEEKH